MRVWSWPGNTSDTSVLPEVRDGMRDWKLGRVVTVVDRGFSSNANLDYLRKGGGQWIAGERMRDKAGDAAEALSRQGRFTVAGDHLHVKEAKIGTTPASAGSSARSPRSRPRTRRPATRQSPR